MEEVLPSSFSQSRALQLSSSTQFTGKGQPPPKRFTPIINPGAAAQFKEPMGVSEPNPYAISPKEAQKVQRFVCVRCGEWAEGRNHKGFVVCKRDGCEEQVGTKVEEIQERIEVEREVLGVAGEWM